MKTAVSVIVPVYNLEFYVERCLQSVLDQRFDRPFELVVVDDGSTDESARIVEEMAQKARSPVRAFTKANGGHGSACNYGIERAAGEFILLLDGDDFLKPTVLQEMYDKAVATRADLLIGNLNYHFDAHCEPFRPLLHIPNEKTLDVHDRSRLFANWATPNARLYRRTLFADPGVRFREGIIHADVNFCPKTYVAAGTIHYVNREWYEYDLTRPTQSMKATNRKILDVIPSLRDMLEYCRKKGALDSQRYELEYYTLMHALSWIPKIARLSDYPVELALRQLFAVMDDFFPGWPMGRPLRELRPGRKDRLLLQMVHATGFHTLEAQLRFKQRLKQAHASGQSVAHSYLAGLDRARRAVERVVGDLDSLL